MMIAVFYMLILLLVYSILLRVFKIVDDILDLFGVDSKFSGYRADVYFILDDVP